MKCSKCGHRSSSIQAMAAHYRKAHPKSMSRKSKVATKKRGSNMAYCPHCGRAL